MATHENGGLTPDELAAESASSLPDREAMSVISGGQALAVEPLPPSYEPSASALPASDPGVTDPPEYETKPQPQPLPPEYDGGPVLHNSGQ